MQPDFLAGVSVAALVIPQGMSYAKIAGLPSVYGLYGAFVPVLCYAALGTSRHLVSFKLVVTTLNVQRCPVLLTATMLQWTLQSNCELPHEALSPCCTASSTDRWVMGPWVLTSMFTLQAVGPVAVTSLLLGQGLGNTIDAPIQANPNKPADQQAQDEYNHAAIQVLLPMRFIHKTEFLHSGPHRVLLVHQPTFEETKFERMWNPPS